jgi:hypothetical protein
VHAAERARIVAPGIEQDARIAQADAGRARPLLVALDQSRGQLRAALGQAAELDDQVGDARERAHHHDRLLRHRLAHQPQRHREMFRNPHGGAAEFHDDHGDASRSHRASRER